MVPSNGVLTVPWEVLDRPGCLRISAVGHAPGKRRPTAIMQQPLVIAANGRIEGTPPQEYTPALWEQMMARLEETSRHRWKEPPANLSRQAPEGRCLQLAYRMVPTVIQLRSGELYTQAYIPGNPDLFTNQAYIDRRSRCADNARWVNVST